MVRVAIAVVALLVVVLVAVACWAAVAAVSSRRRGEVGERRRRAVEPSRDRPGGRWWHRDRFDAATDCPACAVFGHHHVGEPYQRAGGRRAVRVVDRECRSCGQGWTETVDPDPVR